MNFYFDFLFSSSDMLFNSINKMPTVLKRYRFQIQSNCPISYSVLWKISKISMLFNLLPVASYMSAVFFLHFVCRTYLFSRRDETQPHSLLFEFHKNSSFFPFTNFRNETRDLNSKWNSKSNLKFYAKGDQSMKLKLLRMIWIQVNKNFNRKSTVQIDS